MNRNSVTPNPRKVPRTVSFRENGTELLRGDAGSIANHESLLDSPEAAAYLGVLPHTLEVWRCTQRYYIPYIKVGRRVKYRRSELDSWLVSRTVCPPASRNGR